MKYETPNDPGVLDCKGLEMIRRDSCPLVQNIMAQSLKMLFTTHNITLTKAYLQASMCAIKANAIQLSQYIFCREVCFGKYSKTVTPPPSVVVAVKLALRYVLNLLYLYVCFYIYMSMIIILCIHLLLYHLLLLTLTTYIYITEIVVLSHSMVKDCHLL